nr:transposase [Myroides sp. N17-2]
MFNYSPTRSGSAALPILKNFKGYLQTDGFSGVRPAKVIIQLFNQETGYRTCHTVGSSLLRHAG